MSQKTKMLNRIIHYLILNASFIRDLGLLDGKMGICIFFYLYARQTGSKLYEELGGYLLDEIYKEITQSASIGFAQVCSKIRSFRKPEPYKQSVLLRDCVELPGELNI